MSTPDPEVNEADLAEQRSPVGDDPSADEAATLPGIEVDEADAWEQATSVEGDDDAYPHDSDEPG